MFNAASSTRAFVRRAVSLHPHLHLPRFFATPVGEFMHYLTLHIHAAYFILFLGAYFETLVGTSFFILGEVFFLAGSILAGIHVLNIWFVISVLYAGAILGDSSSYFIGKWLGSSIFKEERKLLSMKNYRRIENLLQKYGPKAIFFARFVGFSKVAPVLAGIFEIPFTTFLAYNIPGVIVGVGEFIAVGYFFGNRYELILVVIERYVVLLFVLIAVLLFLRWHVKKYGNPFTKKRKDAL